MRFLQGIRPLVKNMRFLLIKKLPCRAVELSFTQLELNFTPLEMVFRQSKECFYDCCVSI